MSNVKGMDAASDEARDVREIIEGVRYAPLRALQV